MTSSSFTADNWSITAPNYWPPAPQAMSFSALQQIEACPLQWALLHAKYADLGTARGYPQSSNFSALRGNVLHRTLSVVIRELVAAGCTGLGDSQAIAVMKSMGGFTALISRTIDDVLAGEADNFRMRAHQSSLRLRFVRELPEIRERLQFLLSEGINHSIPLGRRGDKVVYTRSGSGGFKLVPRLSAATADEIAKFYEVHDDEASDEEFPKFHYKGLVALAKSQDEEARSWLLAFLAPLPDSKEARELKSLMAAHR